jgi:hypothetical protein
MTEEKEDFFGVLEAALRDVLNNKKSTTVQKLAAIDKGTKLLMVKNKLKDPEADDKSFFGKK